MRISTRGWPGTSSPTCYAEEIGAWEAGPRPFAAKHAVRLTSPSPASVATKLVRRSHLVILEHILLTSYIFYYASRYNNI
jgi:hypothetical protein